MVKFADIRRICAQNDIEIVEISSPKKPYCKDGCLFVPKNWINNTCDNDSFFDLLICISEWKYFDSNSTIQNTTDKKTKDIARTMINYMIVSWAVFEAKCVRITISAEKQVQIEKRYKLVSYDFSEVTSMRMKDLVDEYGLLVKVWCPKYFGDFYFLPERIDKKKKMIYGSEYRAGKLYREWSYPFGKKCSLYYDSSECDDQEDELYDSEDVNYNNSIRGRIINRDAFDEVSVNNSKLLNHQKAGFLLAERYDKFAFFYDTGTGKTVMTLSIIKQKQEDEDAHFLILAPKSIIKTAWMEDSENFFPDLRILPISNNIVIDDLHEIYKRWERNGHISEEYNISDEEWKLAQEELEYDEDTWEEMCSRQNETIRIIKDNMKELADHYIVNIEKLRYDPDAIMDNYNVNGLVIDESAVLKNPQTQNARTVFKYADCFDYIYLLSGKPAPNNSTEYYAQMRLVDPNTFNMSYASFKKCFFTGSGSNIRPINAKAEDDVANMVAVRSLIVSKEDCLDLPEIYREIRKFRLPEKIMKQYDRLYEYCIFKLGDDLTKNGVNYSNTCRLAVFTKLKEVASGFFIDDYKDVEHIHDLKTEELERIVIEKNDEQIIVWCQFEYEILQVTKMLSHYGKTVTAYGKTDDIDESIRLFKSGKARYIVAHPKSIKYGVTFVNCNTAVYYSMSYSAEDYYQSRDRIHRLGQERICSYYFIQAQDTIDEIMYEAVEKKMSYAEIFSVIVKQAAKHGINYADFKLSDKSPIRDELISTQNVKHKYGFNIIDDKVFAYKYNKRTREAALYNTLLSTEEILRPEQLLLEIGIDQKREEFENEYVKDDRQKPKELTYKDVIIVSKWVLSEMKELNIKRIQKVYDYLEEQIQKQYEYDVLNGVDEVADLDSLALKKSKKKKQGQLSGTKSFHFGQMGTAKKTMSSLMDVRHELEEVFFDSGKYRLTHKCFCGDKTIAHCHLDLGLIYQSKRDYNNMTPQNLFDLLHEIGHLETNTPEMTRHEEECFATKWAVERMKLYDFKLPKQRQKEFDEYINSFSSEHNRILTQENSVLLDWEE